MNRTRLAVFGSVDGLTMFMGIVVGILISGHGSGVAWHAALGGATGELVGMTAGQHTSDPAAGWPVALLCGTAGAVACILPAVPYAVTGGTVAAGAAGGIAAAIGAVVCWLRPEKGWRAIAATYGVLAAAAGLSAASGLI